MVTVPADIGSYLVEAKRFDPGYMQPVSIPLYDAMTASVLNGAADWTVPNRKKFVLFDAHPILAVTAPSGETDGFGIWQQTGAEDTLFETGIVIDRIHAKALNCRALLTITNDQMEMFVKNRVSIYDLITNPESIFDEAFPNSFPGGTQFALSLAAQDSGGMGTSTLYGVMLSGILIPSEE